MINKISNDLNYIFGELLRISLRLIFAVGIKEEIKKKTSKELERVRRKHILKIKDLVTYNKNFNKPKKFLLYYKFFRNEILSSIEVLKMIRDIRRW